jgi:tetratricopeptide (TPR) repeat protein
MMEAAFTEDLRLLQHALRNEGFRFILIGHNRHSLYTDLANWVRSNFPGRRIEELRFQGKDYRQLTDDLKAVETGMVLIPDFDWILRAENASICQAFNQRRDFFAKQSLALICFIQPGNFRQIPLRLPDWWSIRSLEMGLEREESEEAQLLTEEPERTSLGGQTREEQEAEIGRLMEQLALAEADNLVLRSAISDQLGKLYFQLADHDAALSHWQNALQLSRKSGDKAGEGTALNNLSQIFQATGDYHTAIQYLEQSLPIQREVGDKAGEGDVLNNLGYTFRKKGEDEKALAHYEKALAIQRAIGNKVGEATSLINISLIATSRGDHETEHFYLEQALGIAREGKAKAQEGTILNNLALNASAKGEYESALMYLEQSLRIRRETADIRGLAISLHNKAMIILQQQENPEESLPLFLQAYSLFHQVGSPNEEMTRGYLDAIKAQIGEARFEEIVAKWEADQAMGNEPQKGSSPTMGNEPQKGSSPTMGNEPQKGSSPIL